MRHRRRAFSLVAMVACALAIFRAPAASQQKSDSLPKLKDGFDVNAMDKSIDPCVDFYHYACGTWLKKNPVPPDKAAYGRFTELADRNREILRGVLEKATAANPGRSANEQKIGDYYASCMDESSIEKKGTAALQPELARIDALKGKDAWASLLAHFSLNGTNAFFGFGAEQDAKDSTQQIAVVGQGGLGLPDRDFYFRDDPKSIDTRKQYVQHMQNMFVLFGEKEKEAAADSQTVMRIETALAKGSLDRVARRDPTKVYHKMSVEELQALSPAFEWSKFIPEVGLTHVTSLDVSEPEYIRQFQTILTSSSLDDIKVYLRWHVMSAQTLYLPSNIDKESFHFYGQVLAGQQEQQARWRRCVNATDNDLGEALGEAYVERTFGAEGKERTLQMVNALERALERDIIELPWMTETTKRQALIKLHKITNKIGYPDKWRDYSTLQIIRGDALGNSFRSNEFESKRQLDKIGKPVDPGEWLYTPPTVNAYYYPPQNNINFMAGILQPPFYEQQMDDPVNFGAIGVVIGHELTHGFDDQGRQYDAEGNLRDWWAPEDEKGFKERTDCEVQEYNDFTVVGGEHVNGNLTLGENTADNGGLRIAYAALMEALAKESPDAQKSIDGLTPEQRFFLGFGQIWCTNATPQALRLQVQTNPHSPAEFRVNGSVNNFEEFGKAFGCKAGQPMVRANACRVW
ncbi:MAG TPA: M13 family metallopeptidase [Candidatus Sulfotelmatobacter sp.]|nr:M13 family metallopeptidase [Candidatus Sulfotelmatobacter sp.]